MIGQEQLKGLKAEELSYYQVLIDQRDFPFMVSLCVCAREMSLCVCAFVYEGCMCVSVCVCMRAECVCTWECSVRMLPWLSLESQL